MTKILVLLLLAAAPFAARAETTMTCDYVFYSAPMAKIVLYFEDDGTLKDMAKITMNQASTHWESITRVEAASGETLHAWLSKDTPNEIEMILYQQAQKQGRSKIVNHASPYAKEIWGDCKN